MPGAGDRRRLGDHGGRVSAMMCEEKKKRREREDDEMYLRRCFAAGD